MTFQVQIYWKDQNWPKLTPEKKVAHIELYHTFRLMFSQPQEIFNKYFNIFNITHIVILCGLAKAIARHSLTGLNIIIFHGGLFNISYCHYNQ